MSTSIFKLLTSINQQQKIREGQPLTISAYREEQFSVVYIEIIGQPNINGLQYRFNENDEWKTYTPDLKFHFIQPYLVQQFLDVWGIGTEQYDALNEQLAQAIENNIFLQQIQFRNIEQTLSLDENNYVHIVIEDAAVWSIQGISDELNEVIFSQAARYYQYMPMVQMTLSGNVQSLLNYREDCTPYCFYKLFENIDSNVGILNSYISVDVQLPSVKLAEWCYAYMFSKWLFTDNAIPALPAMTLAPHCYDHMYYQTAGAAACFGLQYLTLPATELAQGCYEGMFAYLEDGWQYEDSYLYNAIYINPDLLRAEKLAPYCYKDMFRGVRIYPQLPMLPATELAQGCYEGMFADGLAAYDFNTGDAAYFECPELPATELAEKCYSEMFAFNEALIICTLPATILAKNCYKNMFRGCYNLNSINVAFTDWGDIENPTEYDDYDGELIHVQYTHSWVTELGNLYNSQCKFYCPPELPQQFGNSKIPEGWTVITDPQLYP